MKFFSLSKNHVAIMITLFVVIFFGAIYFFIYIPQNEKHVQEQRFRSLQQVDRNIHANIENSIALMKNLVGAYYYGNQEKDPQIRKYINSYSKENFTLFAPEGPLKPGTVLPSDTNSRIFVSNANREILLEVRKYFDKGDSGMYRIRMNFSFEQFTKYLLPENVFDEYIVFSNGQVAYETFPSGISYTKDSLLGRKNGISAATVRSLTAGGVDYKAFLQPITLTADSVWIVGGLLSNKHYQLEKNQLPSNIILLLTTLMLIIVVAFPWLKLFQMGSKDRLTVSDGISTIIVSMLLISLLFFSFFKYNTVFRKEIRNSEDPLAEQVMKAFEEELDTARMTIYRLDERVAGDTARLFRDKTNLGASRDSFFNAFIPIKDTAGALSLNQVFWLRPDGTETHNWIKDSVQAPHGNFRNRNYFRRVVNKDMYQRDDDIAHPYFLDQVISWNTGVFTSVLSIPSKVPGQAMAGMSFNMKSLRRPVLPAGYDFAIIDQSGNVLYHSREKRNLRENLLDEFSEKQSLMSNLAAGTAADFGTRYFGDEYHVHVRPLPGLPYSIAILANKNFKETRDMEIYSFTFSMLFMFFALLVFQLFVIFLAASRHSFFKKQLYETSWVGPKISAHPQYNQAIVFNTMIIILAMAFFNGSSFLTYLYILLFSVTALAVFINKLFALKYKRQGSIDNVKFKNGSLWSLGICIAIIDGLAFTTLEPHNSLHLMFYELLVALISVLLWWKGEVVSRFIALRRDRITRYMPKQKRAWDYTYSFTLMALTRLIITSGIPVAFFYIASYDFEQNSNIRYRQLQYARALQEKMGDSTLGHPLNDNSFTRGYYLDSAWINSIGFAGNVRPGKYSDEEKLTSKILSQFHIYLTDQSVLEDRFLAPSPDKPSFFYQPVFNGEGKVDSATSMLMNTGIPGRYLKITAAPLNYKLPPLWSGPGTPGIYYYLIFLLALIIFYFLIYKILGKIFCFNLPDLSLWKELDEQILSAREVNRLVFIIGLPGSGKLTRILEHIAKGEIQSKGDPLVYKEDDPEHSNVYIADLIHIPDSGEVGDENKEWAAFLSQVFDTKHHLIVVNHFEYNIQDPVTNRIKLNFLEDLMRDNHAQVIILSTIHPVAFLDSVMDPSVKSQDQSIPGQDLERWHVLLGHYRIVVFPLEQSAPMDIEPEYSLRPVYRETEQTHFLRRLQQSVLNVAQNIPEKERAAKGDELAFKLQVTSHYFYMYIWQSLTKEEKFLLYDLAEDNLVNSYDDYNLNMLLAKGVIIRPDGILKLFNKGFRNFILTAIGNTEAQKIQNHIKDNGNWNKLKTPMLIVILAILTFLFTSQEEAYSKMIAYVAALAAGVPTVLKIFSLFGNGGEKKE